MMGSCTHTTTTPLPHYYHHTMSIHHPFGLTSFSALTDHDESACSVSVTCPELVRSKGKAVGEVDRAAAHTPHSREQHRRWRLAAAFGTGALHSQLIMSCTGQVTEGMRDHLKAVPPHSIAHIIHRRILIVCYTVARGYGAMHCGQTTSLAI